jgi:hypothetical protein
MSSQIDHLLEFGFSTQSAYRVRILKSIIFSSSDTQIDHLLEFRSLNRSSSRVPILKSISFSSSESQVGPLLEFRFSGRSASGVIHRVPLVSPEGDAGCGPSSILSLGASASPRVAVPLFHALLPSYSYSSRPISPMRIWIHGTKMLPVSLYPRIDHLLEFKLITFMSSQIDHLLEFGFSTQSAYRVRILKPMIFSSSDPQVNHLL